MVLRPPSLISTLGDYFHAYLASMPENKKRTALPGDCDDVTQYIFHNYPSLLTAPEKLAWRSVVAEVKADSASPELAAMIIRKWGCSDPTIQALLGDGPVAFYTRVRDRVLNEHPDTVILNRCPKCSALARTPTACLCPACNHTWFERRTKIA